VEGLTRVGRGGTNVPTDVVAVPGGGASVGIVTLVCLVTSALVEVTVPAFVALVGLVARARVVVVGLVPVLATTRLGVTAADVAEGRRRAGALFAVGVAVLLTGARLVELTGAFGRDSSVDIVFALPVDATHREDRGHRCSFPVSRFLSWIVGDEGAELEQRLLWVGWSPRRMNGAAEAAAATRRLWWPPWR